jgi:hypothetical protein
MTIPPGGREVKPPDDHLAFAWQLQEMGVPIFCARLLRDGNPNRSDRRWIHWEQTEPGPGSARNLEQYRPGDAVCAVGGVKLDWLDYDPRNDPDGSGRKWIKANTNGHGPVTRGTTPSGGWHMGIPSLGLPKGRVVPGVDYQGGKPDGTSRGFVFIPSTLRPSKVTGEILPYSAEVLRALESGDADRYRTLRAAIEAARGGTPGAGDAGEAAPGSIREAMNALRATPEGGRHEAMVRFMMYLAAHGDDEMVTAVAVPFRRTLHEKHGWKYRQGSAEADVRSYLVRPGRRPTFTSSAEAQELSGLALVVQKDRPVESAEDLDFWQSRKVLWHIHEWALARRAAPWAVLGECMIEAVCHTYPSVQTMPLVGGNGTLNMLVALVGDSGAGKHAATQAARDAFVWHGSPVIPDKIARKSVGSGEGVPKCFGRIKTERGQPPRVVRTDHSVILTISEVDMLQSLSDRGGSTLTEQLRMLYSGEQLGFQYSHEPVLIDEHEYRAAVIAHVQPGRANIIMTNAEGGFPQRWAWFPAANPARPEVRPCEPDVMEWYPPDDCSDDSLFVIPMCGAVVRETDRIADLNQGGLLGDLEAHRNYTRIKIACALALLDGRCEVADDDWDLSGYVMARSDATRDVVEERLAEVKHMEVVERGREDGVRRSVAMSTKHMPEVSRVATRILGKIGTVAWWNTSDIRGRLAGKEKKFAGEALEMLVSQGRVKAESFEYNGIPGMRYRGVKPEKTDE